MNSNANVKLSNGRLVSNMSLTELNIQKQTKHYNVETYRVSGQALLNAKDDVQKLKKEIKRRELLKLKR